MKFLKFFKFLTTPYWLYVYYEETGEFEGEEYIYKIPTYRYNEYRKVVEENTWAYSSDKEYTHWVRMEPYKAKIWLKHHKGEGESSKNDW